MEKMDEIESRIELAVEDITEPLSTTISSGGS
jgi:hypothetical protein